MKHIVATLMVTILCGCRAVFSPYPVGNSPTNLRGKEQEWEGTWINSEGSMEIQVRKASRGVLQIRCPEAKDNGLKSETFTVLLRDCGDWMFANYEVTDESLNGYFWGRVKMTANQILIWFPDEAKFKDLVKDGQLPGVINDTNPMSGDPYVRLGKLMPKHLELITSETNGILFNWEEPWVLIRPPK